MDEMLTGSLVWRLATGIAAWIVELFSGSKIIAAIGSCFRGSKVYALLCSVLDGGVKTVSASETKSSMERFNGGLAKKHCLKGWIQNAGLYRLWVQICQCGSGSRILKRIFSGGMTSVVLVCVPLYAGIDYILRDVLAVPVLSSCWDEALLLFAVLLLVYQRLDRKNPIASRVNPMDFPILIFVITGFVLMNLVNPYPSIQLSGYRATVQYLLWFFLVTRLIRDDKDFMLLYFVFVGLAVVLSLHGIYQYIAKVPMPSSWMSKAETAVRTRVYSIFGSPNIMGDFLILSAPMAAGLAYVTKNKSLQFAAWCCAFLMCLTSLFTMSRASWGGLGLAILIFIVLVDMRLMIPMVFSVSCALFVPFVRTRLGFLFTDDFAKANSFGGRAGRKLEAMKLLMQNDPRLGVGLGMFGGAVAMQNQVLDNVDYFYVDNYYLKILVEMGYVGLASFLLMAAGFLVNGARAVHRTRQRFIKGLDRLYPLCAAMFSGLCGVLLHCKFENIFEEPYMMVYFWTLAGMVIWAGFLRKGNEEAK